MGTLRGVLVASVVSCFVACADTPPTAPSAPQSAPSPVVSGTVFETINGVATPVAGQFLALFIQETQGLPPGITLRGSVQYLSTGSDGRYSAEVPTSQVFVSASWGKRQPCVASVSVAKPTTLDVEVFSARPATLPANPGPLITGLVYETTSNGRRPIPNAEVWVDLFSDAYIANTLTDAEGRFSVCGVNTTVRIDVWAEGYQGESAFFAGQGNRSFEFNLKR